MPRYIAFLRAINVGGHVVKMDELRRRFVSLGFAGVETFINSGNMIFESAARATAPLEEKIERCLEKALGYEVATFLRTDAQVAQVAKYTPFPEAATREARTFCVGFLKGPMQAEQVRGLMGLKTEIDDFHVNGSEFYWLSRVGQSDSKFTNVLFEKKFGLRSTLRGMNTVQKLATKYPG